jgi:hypothetical protein
MSMMLATHLLASVPNTGESDCIDKAPTWARPEAGLTIVYAQVEEKKLCLDQDLACLDVKK